VDLVVQDEATVCDLDTINTRLRNVGVDACSRVEDADPPRRAWRAGCRHRHGTGDRRGYLVIQKGEFWEDGR
jgi:hypothetical protein